MIKVEDLRIGDKVYVCDPYYRTINNIEIQNIVQDGSKYYVSGEHTSSDYSIKASVDYVYKNKEEAIRAYLKMTNEEVIKVITSVK